MDAFVPESGNRATLKDGHKNKSHARGRAEGNAEKTHPSEGPVDEDAEVEKQDGSLVESDGNFVSDLSAIEPLERRRGILVVRSRLFEGTSDLP